MEDLLEVSLARSATSTSPTATSPKDGLGGYVVSGSFDVDRVGDLFPSFHREEDIESTTVGGLVSEWLGRVAQAGRWWIGMAIAWRCWPATICAWTRLHCQVQEVAHE